MKYGFLFIGFTFVGFFMFDIIAGARVAPAEYLLTGIALVLFFVLLLAFAGIPLTSGFTAKIAAFVPAIQYGGAAGAILVVVGVLCSIVTAYAYFKVAGLMFRTPEAQASSSGDVVEVSAPSLGSSLAITLGVVVTVALGVFPGPLLNLFESTTTFLR